MKSLFALAAVTLTLTALAAPSQAASFNCRSSALTYTERTICDNPKLSRMDSTMSATYFGIVRTLRGAAKREVQQDQVAWLGTRNGCGASVACLTGEYDRHIADLRSFYAP